MKQQKNRYIFIALIVSTLILLLVSSMAFFTDKINKTAGATASNIKVSVIESQLNRCASDEDDIKSVNYINQLVNNDDYAASHSWSGMYYSDDTIKADAATYKTGYFADNASNILPGNSIHKMIYILNESTTEVYVRAKVEIPVQLFDMIMKGSKNVPNEAIAANEITSKALDYYSVNGMLSDVFKVTVEGNDYYSIDILYTNALKPGEMTYYNCWQTIGIDPDTTAEQLATINSFDINVYAEAIQKTAAANATDAFSIFDGE